MAQDVMILKNGRGECVGVYSSDFLAFAKKAGIIINYTEPVAKFKNDVPTIEYSVVPFQSIDFVFTKLVL